MITIARLGRSVLGRWTASSRAGGRTLARSVVERHRPSFVETATRLARGRTIVRSPTPGRAEHELACAPGLSEFAAQWLFGDRPPEGIPFSSAVAQAALARMSDESSPPSFLVERDEEARVAAAAEAARRAQPVARGLVEEVSPVALSKTGPFRLAPEPRRPVSMEPPPDAGELPREAEPHAEVVAHEPVATELASPHEASASAEPAADRPQPRPLVLRAPPSERPSPGPSVHVKWISRQTAPTPPTMQPLPAEPAASPSGIVRRVREALRPTRRSNVEAEGKHFAGTSGSQRDQRALLPVRAAAPPSVRLPPPSSRERVTEPVPILLSAVARAEHDGERSDSPPPDRDVSEEGTGSRSVVSRAARVELTPRRPRVRLTHTHPSRIDRTPAGTSGVRLGAATGAPLIAEPDGTATVLLAPAAPEPVLPVSAASVGSIARQADRGETPRAAVSGLSPTRPAQAPAAEPLDMDEVYEQVVERLRRDVMAERERMGDLLGDLRR